MKAALAVVFASSFLCAIAQKPIIKNRYDDLITDLDPDLNLNNFITKRNGEYNGPPFYFYSCEYMSKNARLCTHA